MSMYPHACRSDSMDFEIFVVLSGSPLRVRCRAQIRLCRLQFDGGAIRILKWPDDVVGKRYLENVG